MWSYIEVYRQVITFKTARDIVSGEELTFYYGSNLWFQDNTGSRTPAGESTMHEHMDDEAAFLNSFATSEWHK